ncbi:FAD-dependent oxidoreductase [Litoribacter populi]|uniref:FAD-dependent oxidoreductase n=1 Tax=Litoribacter populi TaxID=2598460 RepID=UPI00163DC493|nr:FAD-dependent oxidoreductase [Litoribacter populi]
MKDINKSLWEENEYPSYSILDNGVETQVCVIGGGITGLTTALLLKQKGFDVILLERGKIGSGTTGHTTGHITSAIDFYYHRLIRFYGEETSKEIFMATVKARKLIENLINSYQIEEAKYKNLPVTYFADKAKQMDEFFKERDAFEKLGVGISHEHEWKIEGELTSFSIHNQGMMDALGYLHGLSKALTEAGGRICEYSPVTDFTHVKDKWHVKVNGHFVVADHLVQATHTPLGLNPVQMEMVPHNSYVMVFKPKLPVQKGMFYDFDSPYHYIRPCEVNGEDCYMLGGADNKSGKKNQQQQKMLKLRAYAEEKFGIEKIHHEWTSMFFEPSNELPFIGKTPFGKNNFIACGFSGDGLTFGTISAMMISSLISEGRHPLEKVFSPSRVEFNAIPFILRENLNNMKHLIGDRIKLKKEKIKTLQKGKGIIVKMDEQTVGVSLDDNGDLHGVVPICPHMKCLVKWNDQGQTWDCGCHGSRFNAKGEVVAGPSMNPLPSVKVEVQPIPPITNTKIE